MWRDWGPTVIQGYVGYFIYICYKNVCFITNNLNNRKHFLDFAFDLWATFSIWSDIKRNLQKYFRNDSVRFLCKTELQFYLCHSITADMRKENATLQWIQSLEPWWKWSYRILKYSLEIYKQITTVKYQRTKQTT